MSEVRNRPEELSFFTAGEFNPSSIKLSLLTEIDVGPNGELVFSFTRSDPVTIARAPASGSSATYITGTALSEEGTLTLSFSNGSSAQIPDLHAPIEYDKTEGLGLLASKSEGVYNFRPFLAGNNVTVSGSHIELPPGQTDMNVDSRAQVVDDNFGASLVSGAWRTRTLLPSQFSQPYLQVIDNEIHLEEGRYLINAYFGIYRSNNFRLRLIRTDVDPFEVLAFNEGGYARNLGNVAETRSKISEYVDVPESGGTYQFQYLSTASYSTGLGVGENGGPIEIWKLR